jgi:Domain of unknown function (DUF397)
MTRPDLSHVLWRKSSRSEQAVAECVEVAAAWLRDGGSGARSVAVRDSKDPDGQVLVFDQAAWRALLDSLKS